MQTNIPFSSDLIAFSKRCVLCWLATVDDSGQPSVSPKEIFVVAPPNVVSIANVASPGSVTNIRHNPKACVSMVDVFAQRGFKLLGSAHLISVNDLASGDLMRPMLDSLGDRFKVRQIIQVFVSEVQEILAPSYRFYPDQTTEQGQIEAAMKAYGVQALRKG